MKKIPEQYKKLLIFCAFVVVAVWIFTAVFAITYSSEAKKIKAQSVTDLSTSVVETATVESAQGTTESTTVETTTTEPVYATIDGNAVNTSAEYSTPQWAEESIAAAESSSAAESRAAAVDEVKSNLPSGKEEIVNTYVKALNKLKNTDSFTVSKQNSLSLTVDSVTGGDVVKNIVNNKISENSDTTPKTYTFVNGTDSATGSTVDEVVPPESGKCSLKADYVESATASAASDSTYIITITLKSDTQTLDTAATKYASCMEVLTMDDLGLESNMTVDSMTINYSSGKISATIDSNGRIISMTQSMTIEKGSGSGKYSIVPVTLEMHGSNSQSYQFSY